VANGFSFSKFRMTSSAQALVLVPTGFCFLQRETRPEGVEKIPQLMDFAALALEGSSPFPQEQLAWGWLAQTGFDTVWVAAALRERLAREALAIDEGAPFCLPALVAACTMQPQKARRIFLWEEDTLSCLDFETGALWPSQIATELLAEPTAQAAFAAREKFLEDKRAADFNGEILPGLYAQARGFMLASGAVSFELDFYENAQAQGQVTKTAWPRKQNALLWQADLREKEFLSKEHKQRARAAWLWRACVGSVVAALLLLLWQSALWVADSSLKTRAAAAKEKEPAVEAIRQNQQLLFKIEQAVDSELRPYAMLAELNRVRLDDETLKSLYFLNLQTEGNSALTLQGKASSIAQVNTYADLLKKSGLFKSVDLPNLQSRFGGADFTLKVDFKSMPQEAPAAPIAQNNAP